MSSLSTNIRRCIIGLSFLIPLIPLVVTASLPFPFISGKGFVFRLIVLAMVALWILLAARDSRYRPRASPLLYVVAAFVLIMALAGAFGEDPYKSFWSNFERMEGVVLLLHLGAYFLVLGSVFSPKEWRAYWYTSLGVALILSCYGALQLAGALSTHQGVLRPDASFGNATYFAGYLLLHVFLALFLAARREMPRGARLSLVSLASIFSLMLVATGTRGAALALALALFILGVYGAFRLTGARRAIVLIGLAGILASPFVLVSMREVAFIKHNGILNRLATASFTSDDMRARVLLWGMALQGIAERPLLGWGQESFNYVFNKNYTPEFAGREEWFDRTHNIFLDWAVAGGVLGFFGYLSLFAAALYMLWRRYVGWERTALCALFVAYATHNFFVFDHLGSSLVFFALLAFLHSPGAPASSSHEAPSRPRAWWYALVVFLAIGFVCAVWFSIVRPVRAGAAVISALTPRAPEELPLTIAHFERALSPRSFARSEARERVALFTAGLPSDPAFSALPPADVERLFFFAVRETDAELQRVPRDARWRQIAASLLLMYGQYEQAREQFEVALALSPNKPALVYGVGLTFFGERKYAEALPHLERAVTLAPRYHSADIVNYYVATLVRLRQFDRAEGMLRDESGYAPSRNDIIIRAYFDAGASRRYLDAWEEFLATERGAHPEHFFFAGRMALAADDMVRARRLFRGAVALDPAYRAEIEAFLQRVEVVLPF